MNLYNSLSKNIEEFVPLDDNEVRIYSCGPTVYDHAHIGNLSSYIYADTLRRVLEIKGYKVKHVMNYTDVDDKTIKRSKEKYPNLDPKEALKKLTDEYIELFQKDIKEVGVDISKINFIKATDYIEDMKRLIRQLLAAKIAYASDDGIYLSIDAYRETGKTYGQLLKISDSSTSAARIDNDEYDKDSVHDFALWKKQKPGEPGWDFEIDDENIKGRPGWHIECSAMSENELNLPFDIHTGGIDLIFPHHENEIAQSTGAKNGATMAKYFVHNNHLLVEGKKMAKSANNFYKLQDVIDKDYSPFVFRFLVLQSHYRYQSNFSWEILEASRNSLQDIYQWSDLRFQSFNSDALASYNERAWQKIKENLTMDLRVPDALTYIHGAIKKTEELGPDSRSISKMAERIDLVLGLNLSLRSDITNDQKSIISKRYKARDNADWEESDRLRDELLAQGIGLKDTDQGTIWYKQ